MADHEHTEIIKTLASLSERVNAGFDGVHNRQDIANGRTAKLENKADLNSKNIRDLQEEDRKLNITVSEFFANMHDQKIFARKRNWELIFFLITSSVGIVQAVGIAYLIVKFGL